MGTNYYFKKTGKHIGKSSYMGGEYGTFIWAIPIKDFNDMKFLVNNGLRIVDEYCTEYSYNRFIEKLNNHYHNFEHIGKEFS